MHTATPLALKVRTERAIWYAPRVAGEGEPDEVIVNEYYTDAQTGERITDPERLARLEAQEE